MRQNIVSRLEPLGQVFHWGDGLFDLGGIPNLHSLVPYSQEAKKPIFDLRSGDGLTGAHISRARNSTEYFEPMVDVLLQVLD